MVKLGVEDLTLADVTPRLWSDWVSRDSPVGASGTDFPSIDHAIIVLSIEAYSSFKIDMSGSY